VPVEHAGHLLTSQRIDKTRIVDRRWAVKHLKTLHHSYRRAPHFAEVFEWPEPLYSELADEVMLSVVNERLLGIIAQYLGIKTPFKRISDYFPNEALDNLDRTERIIRLCKAAGATRYLSGPAAKVYLDELAITRAGVEVEWMDYSGTLLIRNSGETTCPTSRSSISSSTSDRRWGVTSEKTALARRSRLQPQQRSHC
jgi:hypothetical protein